MLVFFSSCFQEAGENDEEMLNEAKRVRANLEHQDSGLARDQTGTQLNI